MWFGSPTIPLTFVLTPDLAGYLADAMDAAEVEGERIDIGWDRPVSICEAAAISGRLLNREFRVRTIPGVINTAATTVGRVSPMVREMGAMMRWVPNRSIRRRSSAPAPGIRRGAHPEEAIASFVRSLGHTLTG
jgi:hypothetical protein